MSYERTINTEVFKMKLDEKGERGLEKFAIESGLSISLLEKVRRGTHLPSSSTRKLICLLLEIKEDELFPFVSTQAA